MLKHTRVGSVGGVLGESRVPLKSAGGVVSPVGIVVLEHHILVAARVGISWRSVLGRSGRSRRSRGLRLGLRLHDNRCRLRRRRRRRRSCGLGLGRRWGGRRRGSRCDLLGLDENCCRGLWEILRDGDGDQLGNPIGLNPTLFQGTGGSQHGAGGQQEQ